MIRLAGSYTLARMLEREDFRTRFADASADQHPRAALPAGAGLRLDRARRRRRARAAPISSSICWSAASSMKERGLEPQVVITIPLLVGTDGTEKMSKSLGNAIAVEDAAREIYGRTMSIPGRSAVGLAHAADADDGQRDRGAARSLRERRDQPQGGQDGARRACSPRSSTARRRRAKPRRSSRAVFGGGGIPDDVPTIEVAAGQPLQAMMAAAGLAPSKSEARRLLGQGAVTVDGERDHRPVRRAARSRRALSAQGGEAAMGAARGRPAAQSRHSPVI